MSLLRVPLPVQSWRRWCGLAPSALAVTVLAALVAACGGGTSQVETYVPQRLVVLGEESSVLDDSASAGTTTGNARKFSVNGVDSTGAVTCNQLPIVPQYVAARYGLVFAQCQASGSTVTPTAFDYAVAGAMVEDSPGASGLATQLANAGTLSSHDLVTVWIGVNDVIDIYSKLASGAYSADTAFAEAQRRGALLAQIINDNILSAGARALVYTVPDLGLSPYARAQVAAGDASAGVRLSELASRFNGYLRTTIDATRFDGRNFGLIFPDEAVQAINANAGNFGLYLVSPYNITDAACGTVPLRLCTNAVDTAGTVNTGGLVTGALYNTHLWASDRWMGYPAHYLLGVQSQNRLAALPF